MSEEKSLSQEEFNLKDAYQNKCIYAGGRSYGAKEVLSWCDAFPEEADKLGLTSIDHLMGRFTELATLLMKVTNSKDADAIRNRLALLVDDASISIGKGAERETLVWLIKQLRELCDGGNNGK